MKWEGVQRQQTRDNDGAWRDLYFYGLLREEYTDRQV
jgi:RimJ/RimL family protein N-acetyltransferase